MNVWMHIEMLFFLFRIEKSILTYEYSQQSQNPNRKFGNAHLFRNAFSEYSSGFHIHSWANFTVEGVDILSAILGLNIAYPRQCVQVLWSA
jgi:hypothetical protein